MRCLYKTFTRNQNAWQDLRYQGAVSGTFGEANEVLGLVVSIESPVENIGVCYQGHFADVGWTETVSNGTELVSQGRRLEAVRISLFGEASKDYSVIYRTHVEDYGWLNWTADGNTSGTEGLNKRLEAVQIYIVPKGELLLEVNRTEANLAPIPVTEAPIAQGESEESKRQRVVDTALSYVGYTSGINNHSIFGERYGDPNGEWCAYFTMSVFADAGLEGAIPQTGYCPSAVNWFAGSQKASLYKNIPYTPKKGDLVYFDYNLNGTPDHVEIVLGASGGLLSTVGGNTGSPRAVRHKPNYYKLTDRSIYAYGVPDYTV